MIDAEISWKSLLFVAESLEQLIGQHGAKAVMRKAGMKAAASLTEMPPQALPEEEAARRAGALLVDFGFFKELQMPDPDTLQIIGSQVDEDLRQLNLQELRSVGYYSIGLFEGFYKQMSGSNRKVISVLPGTGCEYWKLG
jgi:hypothetical protein